MDSLRSLKTTYEQPILHDTWEAIYRHNPLQSRTDDAFMDKLLAALKPANFTSSDPVLSHITPMATRIRPSAMSGRSSSTSVESQ